MKEEGIMSKLKSGTVIEKGGVNISSVCRKI